MVLTIYKTCSASLWSKITGLAALLRRTMPRASFLSRLDDSVSAEDETCLAVDEIYYLVSEIDPHHHIATSVLVGELYTRV